MGDLWGSHGKIVLGSANVMSFPTEINSIPNGTWKNKHKQRGGRILKGNYKALVKLFNWKKKEPFQNYPTVHCC